MLKRILKDKSKARIARFMLIVFIIQGVTPIRAWALTSGPSQPEMQSFEPVGTTDLVDHFTGNFNYNIPLLDVEGYPINIAYHSGITMDQEASWVGLGWNINPGNINHQMRGIPDDFNGDKIEKTVTMQSEVRKNFSAFSGAEFFGFGGNINYGMSFSNYSGISVDLSMGMSARNTSGWISGGVNMGIGVSTSDGANFDYGLSASYQSKMASNHTSSITGSFGKAYNSRQGLMNTSFGVSGQLSKYKEGQKNDEKTRSFGNNDFNFSSTPISMSNYVPVITNASTMRGYSFQLKIGAESSGAYFYGGINVGKEETEFEPNGSRNAYGYMYLQNASDEGMLDFTRDKDGRVNRTTKYLPCGGMTYDIYSVNGQGTGGTFRPFRDDISEVYDPYISTLNKTFSTKVEIGAGNLFEAGADFGYYRTATNSGPWKDKRKNDYYKKTKGSLYEPVYFKQSGELTQGNELLKSSIMDESLVEMEGIGIYNPSTNSQYSRIPRSNLIYYFTAKEASDPNISLLPRIPSYTNTTDVISTPTYYNRSSENGYRKDHHISEIVQINQDGQRYIFGIPAMNIEQTEYVHSVDATSLFSGPIPGMINDKNPTVAESISSATGNDKNLENQYHLKTKTPAYSHSFLLTSVLSPDYSDLTGDGVTEDDLGSYTKFNYTLTSNNYKWRTPYKRKHSNLDIGVRSDCHDDKGVVIAGIKENWTLHSIESKNFIARFYTSPRQDAYGAIDDQLFTSTNGNNSYKLDRIVLYSKHDLNNPVKEIFFTYDYSLCKNIPNNSVNPNTESSSIGKLTLKGISIRNGNSDLGLLSPYVFKYEGSNPQYDESKKDVWGEYKSDNSGLLSMSNKEFPYVNQTLSKSIADQEASAWNLTKIELPSGGVIQVNYEQDDYAYVQKKQAMQMVKVDGVGFDDRFSNSNVLYLDKKSPALYLYFAHGLTGSPSNTELKNKLLGDLKTLQYNFEVKISKDQTVSCGIPLQDNIKGYGDVESAGVCSNDPTKGWIKIKPKIMEENNHALSDRKIFISPITASAINYAQYYNNKALYPKSEILNPNPTQIFEALASSLGEFKNYVRNPFITLINRELAKSFNIGRSYVRLKSQGFKRGGGHRVKSLIYSDQGVSSTSTTNDTYGFNYDYTTLEDGRIISSGVASYEPLTGGDENPNRDLVLRERVGQERKFPMTEPMELVIEEPIGESLFPPASVGYSKVTVTSIHKEVSALSPVAGASSQVVQVHEFYTAKDFPVIVQSGELQNLEDKYPKKINFQRIKKDIYRVAQGYRIILNDMHGKPKANRTFIASKDDATKLQETAYTLFEYKEKLDGATGIRTLDNEVKCYNVSSNINTTIIKELGVESDIMYDVREKNEVTRTYGLNMNTNTFLVGTFPIPIPMPIPQIPKGQNKTFSSVVVTKVIQKYGIVSSVETFDKGAKVKQVNDAYDALTGQVLLSHITTEHNDKEFSLKTPAYYAYNAMGPSYQNILYEEDIDTYSDGKASIINDTCYIYTDHPERFNKGDELTFTINKSCELGSAANQEFKLWVVDKPGGANIRKTPNLPNYYLDNSCFSYSCPGTSYYVNGNTDPFLFKVKSVCDISGDAANHNFCTDELYSKGTLSLYGVNYINSTDKWINNYPVEKVVLETVPGFCLNNLVGIPCNSQHSVSGDQRAHSDGHNGSQGNVLRKEHEIFKNPNWNNSLGNYATYFGSREDIRTTSHVLKIDYDLFIKPEFYNHISGDVIKTSDFQGNGNNLPVLINLLHTNPSDANEFSYNNDFMINKLPSNYIKKIAAPEILWNKLSIYVPYNPNLQYSQNWLTDFSNGIQKEMVYSSGFKLVSNGNNCDVQQDLKVCGGNDDVKSISHFRIVNTGATLLKRSEAYSTSNNHVTIACIPLKRGATSVPLIAGQTAVTWPSLDSIESASIKIVRSGKRNLLTPTVQQITSLTEPTHTSSSLNNVININATKYAENTMLPSELNPNSIYFNDYVTGGKGTFRPQEMYVYEKDREYNKALDKNKGLMNAVKTLWSTSLPVYDNTAYYKIAPILSYNASQWYAKTKVTQYNPWGNDIEVKDASGSMHCNLFGYGNKVPIAVVSNSASKYSLFDNFEDYQDGTYNKFIHNASQVLPFDFIYYHNPIRKFELESSNPNNLAVTSDHHHSGLYALTSNANVNIPINYTEYGTGMESNLTSFTFDKKKFIFNYWQEVNSYIPTTGKISINYNGNSIVAKPKTPIIDNWVLYEGVIDLSTNSNSSASLSLEIASGAIVDDIRIMTYHSNMKSYVYRPDNLRLVAVLDENHLGTFFEYSPEGKLVRIKKETEKGVLTLKESRESLRKRLNSTLFDLESSSIVTVPTSNITPPPLIDAVTELPIISQ